MMLWSVENIIIVLMSLFDFIECISSLDFTEPLNIDRNGRDCFMCALIRQC